MSNKLYSKNFSLLLGGQIISLFGSSIQRFALSLYLLDLTGSPSIFATILALSMIPVVVFAPIAGILADRADKRKIMIWLDVISGIILTFYFIILLQGNDHYLIIGLVMMLLSCISTIYQASVTTSIPSIVPKDQLLQANSMVSQVSSLSNFLGPILAGMVYGLFGIKAIVIINVISFFVSAFAEYFLVIPHIVKPRVGKMKDLIQQEIKEGYTYLKKDNPIVLRMVITAGLFNLFLVPIFSVGSPYIIKILFGFSSQVYGIVEGLIAVGMMIGAFIIAKNPTKFHITKVHKVLYVSVFSMFMMGFAIHIYPYIPRATSSLFIFTFFGMMIMLVLGIANVLSNTYVQESSDSAMLGKISAFGAAFATICIPLGQIVFGGALDHGVDQIHIIVYLFALCTLGVTLIVRNNVKRIK